MKQARPTNSTEQRRRLLKGMLSASSVVGLGYSASASALASVTQCIANQKFTELTQIYIGNRPPAGSSLAWKEVTVRKYTGANVSRPTEGFKLPNNNVVYTKDSPWTVIQSPVQRPDGGGFPKKGWVVVYFDSSTREEIGAFPQYRGPTPDGEVAQASLNCLNSLNAGIVKNYTFGG